MAGEVIALLHSLLTAPECNTAHSWANAVQRVNIHHIWGLYKKDAKLKSKYILKKEFCSSWT